MPLRVVAELLGHANVYTTMNVYTQSVEGARRAAAHQIGEELFKIVKTCYQGVPIWKVVTL